MCFSFHQVFICSLSFVIAYKWKNEHCHDKSLLREVRGNVIWLTCSMLRVRLGLKGESATIQHVFRVIQSNSERERKWEQSFKPRQWIAKSTCLPHTCAAFMFLISQKIRRHGQSWVTHVCVKLLVLPRCFNLKLFELC